MDAPPRVDRVLTDQRGSVLLLSLALVFVMTLLGAALFKLTVVEHDLVMSDQNDAKAFHAAEGGLYRAYVDLANGAPNAFATVFAGASSQTLYTNQAFSGGGFTVKAEPVAGSVPNKITLTVSGCYPAGSPCPTANSSAFIRAAMTQQLVIPTGRGIFGGTSVNFSTPAGSITDSYDSCPSSPPICANGAAYNAATAGNNGDVTGNGTILLAGVVVNGNVLGTTNTGSAPDLRVSANATVNGTVRSGGTVMNSGTVTGGVTQNSASTAIAYPPVPACGPPYSSNAGMSWTGTSSYNASTGVLVVNGGSNTLTLANGSYCFSSITLSNSATLKVNGPVVIRMALTTSKVDFSGGTVNNTTASAEKLQILSSSTLATCTAVSTTGVTLSSGTFTHAVVYAPGAAVTLQGGSGTTALLGAVISKAFCVPASSPDVHFDEQLSKSTILQAGQVIFPPMSAWQRCLNATCS